MPRSISITAGLLIVLLAGCENQNWNWGKKPAHKQSEEVAPASSIAADPVAALRTSLPAGWNILETTANTYPFYRPEGSGTAIKLISSAHKGDKPPYDAIVFVMPADYNDGGEDPTHGQAQTTPPMLVCEASNGKVYLWAYGASNWPSIREDICKALMQ